MIAAVPRCAALRAAALRNSTRLWAAWNRFCGSGMPKGIILTLQRSAAQRCATRRRAPHRAATRRTLTFERNPQ